jgi:hypothetical protein
MMCEDDPITKLIIRLPPRKHIVLGEAECRIRVPDKMKVKRELGAKHE